MVSPDHNGLSSVGFERDCCHFLSISLSPSIAHRACKWDLKMCLQTMLVHQQSQGCLNRPISQIPECTCAISHNATFCNRNVHVCTFLLQNDALLDMAQMHCGMDLFRSFLSEFHWISLMLYRYCDISVMLMSVTHPIASSSGQAAFWVCWWSTSTQENRFIDFQADTYFHWPIGIFPTYTSLTTKTPTVICTFNKNML